MFDRRLANRYPAAVMDLSQLTIASIRQHLRDKLALALKDLGADADLELAPAPDPKIGDFGAPCFPLAKQLRKAPPLIAQDVAAAIEPDALIEAVRATGPYVNFQLRKAALVQIVVGEVLRTGSGFGGRQADTPENWMVEYSSPNTNKPLHLGHIRNNLLGASVAAILRHYGHRVTRINLVNDRGVHICKSMLAYQHWGEGRQPDTELKGDHLVGELYVEFDRRFKAEYFTWQGTAPARSKLGGWLQSPAGKAAIKTADGDASAAEQVFFDEYTDAYFNSDSQLGGEVRQMLRQWEAGDEQTLSLWRKLNEWVLSGFEATYERMGVAFEKTQFESDTYKLGKQLVAQGLRRGVFQRREDGAVVCDLTQVGLSGEKVLLRSDGTSVYTTQDLGTAFERFESFELDRLIYVVGDEQNYHFDVLFRLLGLLRPGLTERCSHLAYGMIRVPSGKMKSREGTKVDADPLMDEIYQLARQETQQRAAEGKAHTEGISEDELAHRAEHIGLSALKYYLLKFSPRTSFVYDPKESIDFLGQTGPYCLFNYARTRSLLRRAGGEPAFDADALARLTSDRELELVRLVATFPEVVARAMRSLDPSRIGEFCFDLCKSFAFIFTDKANHPIVTCDDSQLRSARLILVAAVGSTLRTALGLLGIAVLEEM